jgi:class 3 adenylate cyclase
VLQTPNGEVLAIAVRGRPVCDPQMERWRLPDVHAAKGRTPLLTSWADPDGQIFTIHTAAIPSGVSSQPLGTISIGFELDNHSAAVAKARVGTDVVFWRDEVRQSKVEPVLLGTSEPRLGPALMKAISEGRPEIQFKSGNEEWLLADVPPQNSGLVIDNAEHIHFGVLQSITNIRKSFKELERYLAILAVCALAGGVLLSFNFTRPIVAELNQRQQMLKFLSHTTVDSLEHHGSERRSIVALFSDIRGFTSFCDGRDPASVVERLNQVLSIQAEVVAKHGGDIDKFIGDAMFAWFSGDDRCGRAVAAAREMLAGLDRQFGACAGAQVGIGIHVGEVIAGALGSQDRLDYTAIGSTVNLAERLCSAAHAGQILISQPVVMELGSAVPVRALDPIHVKGFADQIAVYEVMPEVGSISAAAGVQDAPHAGIS